MKNLQQIYNVRYILGANHKVCTSNQIKWSRQVNQYFLYCQNSFIHHLVLNCLFFLCLTAIYLFEFLFLKLPFSLSFIVSSFSGQFFLFKFHFLTELRIIFFFWCNFRILFFLFSLAGCSFFSTGVFFALNVVVHFIIIAAWALDNGRWWWLDEYFHLNTSITIRISLLKYKLKNKNDVDDDEPLTISNLTGCFFVGMEIIIFIYL